ncbi:MAG: YebC/PmpR family DNA-binding transcriptional regulator [Chlamydiales bacterium]|nr:YebC/PmpR family DNA-binding transcriptional regulator [Chlamydiales bacterium]
MAGHSKWANIKHKKDRVDKQKGKVFSRIAKEIISAVKVGGPDPKANPRLRLALQKAKGANVPNDVVDRNIKKASDPNTEDFSEVTYEIYGHGGVGIIVEAMTDNKNRTASDMRIATNKRGGTIGQPGSVTYNFDRKGVIQVPKDGLKEDEVFQAALDAGAEDFEVVDEGFMITTSPTELYAVKDVLDEKNISSSEAEIEWIPNTLIAVDSEMQKANEALVEWLEDLDDVDNVYHNMDL